MSKRWTGLVMPVPAVSCCTCGGRVSPVAEDTDQDMRRFMHGVDEGPALVEHATRVSHLGETHSPSVPLVHAQLQQHRGRSLTPSTLD